MEERVETTEKAKRPRKSSLIGKARKVLVGGGVRVCTLLAQAERGEVPKDAPHVHARLTQALRDVLAEKAGLAAEQKALRKRHKDERAEFKLRRGTVKDRIAAALDTLIAANGGTPAKARKASKR